MVKDELLGKQLGSYQLIQLLGHGAFGSVYLGKHFILANKPPVAIKVLNATLNSQEEFDRFFQEAMMLDALSHPHILPVLDANIYEGYPFFVAEYAAGGSLRDQMDQAPGHPLPLEDALDILNQIGQGLQFAHDHNIVHRDLKPANILFDGDGNALLADFGIAMPIQKTRRADEVGTPAYMAPEQFKGKVSKRSDQYALACIGYELFTGQPIFDAEDPFSIGYQHIHEQPISPSELNPDITPEIEEALMRALAKQRNDRYASVTDFIEALYNAANLEPTQYDDLGNDLHSGGLDDGDEYYEDNEDDEFREPEDDYDADEIARQTPTPHNKHTRNTTPPQQNRIPLRSTRAAKKSTTSSNTPPPVQTTPPARLSRPQPNTQRNAAASNATDSVQRRLQINTPRQGTHIPSLLQIWTATPEIDRTYYAEPSLVNGIVYAGIYSTTTTDQTRLQALSVKNGKTLWSFETDFGIYDAPAVDNGTVYFCAGNINNGGTVYALDADTGELFWTFETEEYLKATPTIANDIVYAYSQHAVFALNAATGQHYWHVTLKATLFGHPYVVNNVVYIATERGNCYTVDADHGRKLATFADIGEMHAAVMIDNRVYGLCVYEDLFYALDMENGETRWTTQIDRHISGGVTVAGNYAYIGSHSGFVGDSSRTKLLAIDIQNGKQQWGAHIRHEIEGAPVIVGKMIVLSNYGHEINVLDTQQGRLLTIAHVGRGKLSRPAVENNIVIVSTGDINAFQLD